MAITHAKVLDPENNIYAVADVRGAYRQGTTKNIIDHKVELSIMVTNKEHPRESVAIQMSHDAVLALRDLINDALTENLEG